MIGELILRFVIGGAIVAVFSATGDVLSPKRFAGMFGAAPSVALATLVLAYAKKPASYAALEGRSMILGAVALGVYAIVVAWLLGVRRWHPVVATSVSWLLWFGIAAVGWAAWLRRA
jgi:hypothetical protein